jgi:hypothetical protein
MGGGNGWKPWSLEMERRREGAMGGWKDGTAGDGMEGQKEVERGMEGQGCVNEWMEGGMKGGVDESNEDKPCWPDPATTAALAGIVSRSSYVARMKVVKPPPDVLPITSNTCESSEFRNAKGYERAYSTSMLRTRCDGSATLLSTPTELVTPPLGENGEGRAVELPEANLDGLLGASAASRCPGRGGVLDINVA